ncbi:sporulation protein [Paenibacillus pasadenensis]|uniref:sporulation protein n=1 Tax=Paenibacillus pasadenensis TaxID=217090 RepID=UPI00203E6809|nr:sporulation protein [Paenibacillus pasadenensis]MCM3747732.1 sporulation protein [Paenibacillus pasadenensis]
MSFFKNMMASMGIGSAQVDTVLEVPQSGVRPGDTITGHIIVKGGSVPQQINGIELLVMTSYIKEVNDTKVRENVSLARLPLRASFQIGANQIEEFDFNLELPLYTPVTAGGTQVWIKTSLDIASALDAGDNDYIRVLPHPLVEDILEAVDELGFRTREVECKYAPHSRLGTPILQEFEFVPRTRSFGRLDELEMVLVPAQGYVDVLMEVDRRSGALSEWLGTDESRTLFRLSESEIRRGRSALANELEQRIRRFM